MDMINGVALVTGAAGGIGREVCATLAARGLKLALTDINAAALNAASEAISTESMYRALDVSNSAETRAFVEEVEAGLGDITVLVNCAGIFQVIPFDEISEDDWELIVRSNLFSVFTTCRIVGPRMKSRGAGSIVNFASTAGEEGSFRPAAHYAAAKGGVMSFSKSLAREISPFGVRVNVVSPGPIDTTMLGADTQEKKDTVAKRVLMGRLGLPRDIADAVSFLAGPESSFITGHVLRVNGGALL